MKKNLLTILGAAGILTVGAQSANWQLLQNTTYTFASGSCKYLDVVSSNVVWGAGYSGAAVSQNHCDYTKTTNGGTSFSGGQIYADTNTYVLANMEGIDANTAWVSAYMKSSQAMGAIHRTTNGGTTWQNMTAPGMYTNSASFCNIVSFVTNSVGITMGDAHSGIANEYEIWRTTDGGTTWALVPGANIPNPTSGEYGLVNVYEKQGTSNFWFGTNKGRVFRSTDAGATWSVSILPSTPSASINVSDIAFSSATRGVCLATNTSSNPAVFEQFVTNDGGVTWTKINNISPLLGRNDIAGIPGTGVFVSAANTTSVANSGGLSYSSDGGITWTSFGNAGTPFLTIDFADANSGWAGTFQSGPATGGIFKYQGSTAVFALPATSVCLGTPNTTLTPTNLSIGTPTGYAWTASSPGVSFSSATASVPVITFTTTGTYTISLMAADAFTTTMSSQVINIIPCVAPTATFNLLAVQACSNIVITTNNTSSGAPNPTYQWSVTPAAGVTVTPSFTVTNPVFQFPAGNYTVTLRATNLNGSVTTTQTFTSLNCVGINETSLNNKSIEVTPNPSNGVFKVNLPTSNNYNVVVTDILGSIVNTYKINASTLSIDLTNKAKGVYFVTISNGAERATKKIILE